MAEQNKKIEKLTDKAFSRLVWTSIIGILICIACLCSSTYAWFTAETQSGGNEIKAATECLLTVTVVRESDGAVLENIEEGVVLDEDDLYTVTMTLPENSASGYFTITTEDGQVYYSDYIARHTDGQPRVIEFILNAETTQKVVFTKRWGIYAGDSNVIDHAEMTIP